MNTTETEIHINAEIEGNFTLPYDTAAFILPQGEKRKLIIDSAEYKSGDQIYLKQEEI
ncbi:hypothetical protein LIT32_07165 [Bacillus sp. CMF21]|nr:hypothetical protein LIT32_07165 [Bacillus sp. CMF21]